MLPFSFPERLSFSRLLIVPLLGGCLEVLWENVWGLRVFLGQTEKIRNNKKSQQNHIDVLVGEEQCNFLRGVLTGKVRRTKNLYIVLRCAKI